MPHLLAWDWNPVSAVKGPPEAWHGPSKNAAVREWSCLLKQTIAHYNQNTEATNHNLLPVLLPFAPVLPAHPHLAAAPNTPDTGTEPGNPGTIAAVPLPNAQTPLGMLACTHKNTHIHTCTAFAC